MTISPLTGKPAPKERLIDLARLEREYYERRPDLDDPQQLVSFGTSGHRGSPLRSSFPENLLSRTRDRIAARLDEGVQSLWRIAHQARLTEPATAAIAQSGWFCRV